MANSVGHSFTKPTLNFHLLHISSHLLHQPQEDWTPFAGVNAISAQSHQSVPTVYSDLACISVVAQKMPIVLFKMLLNLDKYVPL